MPPFLQRLMLAFWVRRAERAMAPDRRAAVRHLDRALRLDPQNATLLSMRGEAKGAKDGAADHEAALALAPDDPRVHARRAIALHRDAEVQLLLKRIGPDEHRKWIEDAAVCCDSALALDPEDRQARFLRASCRMDLGDLTAALADMEALVEREPDNVLDVCRLGEVHARRGAFDEAIDALNRALGIDANCQRAHALRALSRFRLGDRDAARADMDEAIRRDPHDELAHAVWDALEGDDEALSSVGW